MLGEIGTQSLFSLSSSPLFFSSSFLSELILLAMTLLPAFATEVIPRLFTFKTARVVLRTVSRVSSETSPTCFPYLCSITFTVPFPTPSTSCLAPSPIPEMIFKKFFVSQNSQNSKNLESVCLHNSVKSATAESRKCL